MTTDRASAGLEHLQGAALELIAAARAFLDVAEDLVKDPGAAGTAARLVTSLAASVMAAATPQPEAPPVPESSGVRRITLS